MSSYLNRESTKIHFHEKLLITLESEAQTISGQNVPHLHTYYTPHLSLLQKLEAHKPQEFTKTQVQSKNCCRTTLTEYCFSVFKLMRHLAQVNSHLHCLWAYSAPLGNSAGPDHCTPHSVTTSLNTAFTVLLDLLGAVGLLMPNILRKRTT